MIKKELQQELNRTKLVLDYARQEIKEKDKEIERLNNIIKEVREYITSYESISIMQGLMKEYSNYDLDIKTMNEMIRRYMVVHDELLEILDRK